MGSRTYCYVYTADKDADIAHKILNFLNGDAPDTHPYLRGVSVISGQDNYISGIERLEEAGIPFVARIEWNDEDPEVEWYVFDTQTRVQHTGTSGGVFSVGWDEENDAPYHLDMRNVRRIIKARDAFYKWAEELDEEASAKLDAEQEAKA